jgi:phenylacetate-coenzyme A ligase PaaK-like adenylate-forming protein
LPLEEYYRRYQLFYNSKAQPPGQVALAAPWDPLSPSVAVLPWFRLASPVRTLMHASVEEVAQSRPAVLAGSVGALRTVAAAVADGAVKIESLEFGVIAFTGLGRPGLTAADRDLFWTAFGVPVFEQFRGFQGELLAYECEGHEALHWNADTAHWERATDGTLVLTSLANLRYPALRLATGVPMEVVEGMCACGRNAARAVLRLPAEAGLGRGRAARTARQG